MSLCFEEKLYTFARSVDSARTALFAISILQA